MARVRQGTQRRAAVTVARERGKIMARNVYLVGSVPMANAAEVFEKVSAALGPRIKRLPDGETGARGDWITWLEPVFSENPALQKSGEFFRVHASGTGRERYALKPGFRAEDVRFDNLFYGDIAEKSYADFKRLKDCRQDRRRHEIPGRSGAGAFGDLAVPGRCAALSRRSALQRRGQARDRQDRRRYPAR